MKKEASSEWVYVHVEVLVNPRARGNSRQKHRDRRNSRQKHRDRRKERARLRSFLMHEEHIRQVPLSELMTSCSHILPSPSPTRVEQGGGGGIPEVD